MKQAGGEASTRWRSRLAECEGRRCDLEVVLRDEWRHRIAVRDSEPEFLPTISRSVELEASSTKGLADLGREEVRAAVVLAQHLLVRAYGHGQVTVVATIDDDRRRGGRRRCLRPHVLDHEATRTEAIRAVLGQIRADLRADDGLAPEELLGAGYLDSLVMLGTADETPSPQPMPFTVSVDIDRSNGPTWTLSVAEQMIPDETLTGLTDVAARVLEQILGDQDRALGDVDLASEAHERQLREWTATEADFPRTTRLEELFTAAVERTPDATALIFDGRATTYRHLEVQSTWLARWLLEEPVSAARGDLVGLFLDKSDLGCVATLGIWKSGSAYVPIDPGFPDERIRFLLEDAAPPSVITTTEHRDRVQAIVDAAGADVRVVDLRQVLAERPEEFGGTGPVRSDLESSDLAYVTYTSGTTGVPKGVPKEHSSVVNSITDLSERYDMLRPGTERIALYASYVFEPHLRQTLLALLNNQTLVIVPEEVRLDPDQFPRFLREQRVTYLNATGSVLAHFDLSECTDLRRLHLVGEELTSAGLARLRSTYAGLVVNEYAFTEAAFVTAVKECAPGLTARVDRSIGRPVRNVTWYVLSQNGKPLPIGAIGELFIGGCGVAPGYLNRPDLTAERFSDNPFQTVQQRARGDNARLYRTGDLARFLPNGEVEFMGRCDFQLKIHGVRVEPGEIQAHAVEYPGVTSCLVVAQPGPQDGDSQLVGYYTCESGEEVGEDDLLAFLEQRIVRAMVPARMVSIDRIPVNVNGKPDWRALPAPPPRGAGATDQAAVSARSDSTTEGLRLIWSEVLGVPVERIREDDDFFRLGGQSITAILLVGRVRAQLAVHVGVEDVFRHRTLGDLANHLRTAEAVVERRIADHREALGPGEPLALPATGLQQGLLYHALKRTENDDAYVMQSVHRYTQAIDVERMRAAWQHARRMYPALRLRFQVGEEPRQVIDRDDEPVVWRYHDLTDVPGRSARERRIRDVEQADRDEAYDPTRGQLFRIYVFKQADDLFTLLFSCHHIILDGWSLPVLHDTVHRAYLDLGEGREPRVEPDTAYLPAQRRWHEHRSDHLDYWHDRMASIDERGDLGGLVTRRQRYRVALGEYDQVREHRTRSLTLPRAVMDRLRTMCATQDVTLHSALQLVWHQVLRAMGGGNTTVVGTIVSGRGVPVSDIEKSVGLFINTLPMVVDHDHHDEQTVAEALRIIQRDVNDMNAHSTVDLGRLGSDARGRVFDTLLVLENYPDALAESGARGQLLFEKDYDADKVDYPIAVVAREQHDSLTVTLWYAGELFEDAVIADLLDLMGHLFDQISRSAQSLVRTLDLVSDRTNQALSQWNATTREFDDHRTLHGRFEEMVQAWPDEDALVFGDRRFTYRELNAVANRLAHQLRDHGDPRPDDIIGLMLDKSHWTIVAILAVWKTGAAYVPIDPSYPDDRVAFMLSDVGADLVLTNQEYVDRLASLPDSPERAILAVEDLDLSRGDAANPVSAATAGDLAYAIYTSGTTGKPKAVLVEHRGVANLRESLAQLFSLDRRHGREALLSFSNYVFDHFVEQMTDAVLNGQKLVVLDDSMRTDPARLSAYINREQVTYLSGTPSVLSLYDYADNPSLRRIDAIGEDFTEPVFDKIRRSFGGLIINGYGPTEVSITSHKRPYLAGESRRDKSIGHMLPNVTCYILDKYGRQVPVGGLGELYMGGVQVTRGYLNRQDLTDERFVPNPFRTDADLANGENARLYKTGDLVRWLPNGEVEYLGRTDMQVKIRGQRVELGEIEAAMTSHPAITRSLVVAREHDGGSGQVEKYLVGFYLGEADLDEQEIRAWMRKTLPEAYVPTRVLRIEDIPVTPSGKLDAKRLPETSFEGGDGEYAAPSTEIEFQLCAIWSRILSIPAHRIGVQTDFFALGGDSIRAMSLAQAMSQTFGDHVGINTVLQHTVVSAQAREIANAPVGIEDPGLPLAAAPSGRTPVSLAQERLLFIDEFEGGTAAYNIPLAVRVPADRQVSIATIEVALRAIIARHDALRTVIVRDDTGRLELDVCPVDVVDEIFEPSVRAVPDEPELDRLLEADAAHVFDLAAELPIRASINRIGSGEVVLGLVLHHTCFDGWSWTVIREELAALLAGTKPSELPAPAAGYASFARWQREHVDTERQSALATFWVTQLTDAPVVEIPGERPRPERFDYSGREMWFAVDGEVRSGLERLAKSAKVSLYSVLLSAWSLTLTTYSGQHDVTVATPLAGRSRPEFARTVGFFANLLPVRLAVDPTQQIGDFVSSVGRRVVEAQVHGDLPFEQLVKELGLPQDPSRHPVVQINFTLQEIDPADHESVFTDYHPDTEGRTVTKFDLSTTLSRDGDGLRGNLTYASAIYDDTTAHRLVDTFIHLLRSFATESAHAQLADLPLTDEPAGHQARGVDYAPTSLANRFEAVADMFPDALALVAAEPARRLTYAELDQASNQVAHLLRSAGVRPGDLVALVLAKSAWTPIAILGVWKSGAGYVPVDPGSPDERLSYILRDTAASAVLTEPAYRERLRALGDSHVLDVTQHADSMPTGRLDIGVSAHEVAYAIYTSGTTGRPKAVLVEHESVDSFRAEIAERYFGPPTDRRQSVLMLSNYAFDFSVEQLALSLLSGHTLVLPSAWFDPTDASFYDFLTETEVSYLSGTPTQVHQLDLGRIPHLDVVLVAGEAFQRAHFDKIRKSFHGQLYSAYGTTETSVYNLIDRFPPRAPYRSVLGRALGNTGWRVEVPGLRSAPTGGVGELVLSGPCVTRGYLNREDLTRASFGFEADQRTTTYRTGDLVQVRGDGELVFLGRRDSQVKVRGLRVEPGEIEAALADTAGVAEAVVQVQQVGGSEHLVGYYVPEPDAEVTPDALIDSARERLVPSMLPSLVVPVAGGLPLTVNGKLDTAALPVPDPRSLTRDQSAPRTRLEARLCDLWAEHLPVEAVSPHDDFFRVGGDSISALHLSSHVQRDLGRKISVKAIFDHPTVRAFAEHALERQEREPEVAPETGRLTGPCPTTPIQEWFYDKSLVRPDCWNQYLTIRVPEVDPDALQRAVDALTDHHDAFRLRVHRDAAGGVRQEYADTAARVVVRDVDVADLGWAETQRRLRCWQHEFDLGEGPICLVAHLHGDESGDRIYLAAHHLVLDTVSWQILTRDLEVLYNGGTLEEKSSSFRQWADAVRDYPAGADEVGLWEEIAESVRHDGDRLRSVVPPSEASREETWLSEEDTRRLLVESGGAYDTDINDLLLAATGLAFHAVTGSEVHHVTVEGHGRERFPGAPDPRDTVGWFTTMYPSRIETVPGDLAATIRATRDFRRRVPHHGIGYGAVRGPYGRARAPLPTATFNYLGQLETGDAPTTHRWQLDLLSSGSYTHPDNSGSNTSAVDVTMSVVDGRLRTVLWARIGPRQTHRLALEVDDALRRIIEHTAHGRSDEGSAGATPEPYVIVNEDVDRTLFVLPPGEGGAESYLSNLARHLPGWRLVLFDNVHRRSPRGSFGELAEHYLELVRDLQSSGPYSFLGWSFGGVLAVEMSARLAAAGEQVDHLALIDPYFAAPYACERVGVEPRPDILDPINFDFRPDAGGLEYLGTEACDIVLFKAMAPNEIVTGEPQRRLFDHYLETDYNYLDRLLPADRIEVVPLPEATHHSWVRQEGLVQEIAQRLLAMTAHRSSESAKAL